MYRAKLQSYLSAQPGAAASVTGARIDISTLEAKLRISQMRVAELVQTKARLEKFIANKLPGRAGGVERALAASSPSDEKGAIELDYRMAFECTAHALMSVLDRIDYLHVDYERCLILDRSARPAQRQVAGPNHVRWFVEWSQRRTMT
jgi:hypothetical protein